MGRQDNFSREGLCLLFSKYFENAEADTGTPIELDVIAICCEYSEDTVDNIAASYDIDTSDCLDDGARSDAVRDYLESNTSVVGETVDGFVYAQF
jgi:hypothetical protein